MEGIVYKYTSPINKHYIGQTTNEYRRRRRFLNLKESYGGPKIDNARKKYGPENFTYEVLIRVKDEDIQKIKDQLDALEIEYIWRYDSIESGYNCTEGGGGSVGHIPWNKGKKGCHVSPNKGKKMSDEQKVKLSESLKGKTPWNKGITMTDEQKKNFYGRKNGRLGKPCSEETKEKISKANLGRKVDEEGRKNISVAHLGQKAWNKGIPMSDETKKKLSKSLKGKVSSNKGKKMSDEQKAKIRESKLNNNIYKGKHWKIVDGKRVWY